MKIKCILSHAFFTVLKDILDVEEDVEEEEEEEEVHFISSFDLCAMTFDLYLANFDLFCFLTTLVSGYTSYI